MNNSPVVFMDTSFFKAYADIKDQFHQKAIEIFEKLKKSEAIMVTSNYMLESRPREG